MIEIRLNNSNFILKYLKNIYIEIIILVLKHLTSFNF